MNKLIKLGWGAALLLTVSACANHNETSNNKQQVPSQTKEVPKVVQVDWHKPSQNKAYPVMTAANGNYIKVSIHDQRVYVMNNQDQVLYTMYASTGADDSTPRGTFAIQPERGDFFFNEESQEGAKYWTSFKDHGVYLFHTVPTDRDGNYIEEEADLLGKEANSHGCIRLTIPDAKWINEHVPTGTTVIVK